MNENHAQDAAAKADASRTRGRNKKPAPTLTRLSAAEIARRTERQRPGIARTKAERHEVPEPTTPDEEASMQADQSVTAALEPIEKAPSVATVPGVEATGAVPGRRVISAGPRQMTVWEDVDDDEIIAGWVAATTREGTAGGDQDHGNSGREDDGQDVDGAGPGEPWHIGSPSAPVDQDSRRARLRDVTTHYDQYLVQQVRSAVVNLVLEHPYTSDEADRRLTGHGIRFAVWSLARTSDREFDPFRDFTEDRITGFVRDAGRHLSDGSRDTYAAVLRRLAAGPTNGHRGTRRKAVAPLPRRVEDGLWTAADTFAPSSWKHQEAKTLLSLSFGAGAMPAEINLVAPDDVLVDATGPGPRVSIRLLRAKTWVRDVPVIETRYAEWLAARAAQVAGHTYLFKPDRVERRNAINSATRRLAEENRAFERFELNAARNTWAIAGLRAGIPFPEWANAAGVGPGTHLPADLLAHLPTPDPAQVEAAFRRAALREGRQR